MGTDPRLMILVCRCSHNDMSKRLLWGKNPRCRCWCVSVAVGHGPRQQIASIARRRKQAHTPCWACLVRITVNKNLKKKKKCVADATLTGCYYTFNSNILSRKDVSVFAGRLEETGKEKWNGDIFAPTSFEASQWNRKWKNHALPWRLTVALQNIISLQK